MRANFSAENPIGIFDSGIGGLTVARAIKNMLPQESIIYYGDTAHLPYGDKSTAAIQAYAIRIADFLISQQCKMIIVACNSASSAAYDLLKEYLGHKVLLINVIDPVINYCREHFANTILGLIGTKRTIQDNIYQKKITRLGINIHVKALATPLLAPMIEEGFFNEQVSRQIINTYLSNDKLSAIEGLILGCTHYPLIVNDINQYYDGKVKIIDSANLVAESASALLSHHHLNASVEKQQRDVFFVSDFTVSFEESTKLFFGHQVTLHKNRLWD